MYNKVNLTHRVFQYLGKLLIGRSTNDAHNVKQLILVVPTTEERNPGNHLGENAATGPNINGGTIRSGSEKDVGSSVPEGDNLGA